MGKNIFDKSNFDIIKPEVQDRIKKNVLSTGARKKTVINGEFWRKASVAAIFLVLVCAIGTVVLISSNSGVSDLLGGTTEKGNETSNVMGTGAPTPTPSPTVSTGEGLSIKYSEWFFRDGGEYDETAYILENKSELDNYIDNHSFDDEINTMLKEKMGEEFFESKFIYCISVFAESGSINYKLQSVEIVGDEVFLNIYKIVPEIGTDDIAIWSGLITLDREYIDKKISVSYIRYDLPKLPEPTSTQSPGTYWNGTPSPTPEPTPNMPIYLTAASDYKTMGPTVTFGKDYKDMQSEFYCYKVNFKEWPSYKFIKTSKDLNSYFDEYLSNQDNNFGEKFDFMLKHTFADDNKCLLFFAVADVTGVDYSIDRIMSNDKEVNIILDREFDDGVKNEPAYYLMVIQLDVDCYSKDIYFDFGF